MSQAEALNKKFILYALNILFLYLLVSLIDLRKFHKTMFGNFCDCKTFRDQSINIAFYVSNKHVYLLPLFKLIS